MPGSIITFIVAIASSIIITSGLDNISPQAQPSPSPAVEKVINRNFKSTPKPSAKSTPQAPAPKANTSSQITCTGTGGKQFQTTQKVCDEFNAAWEKKPVATFTPTKKPDDAYYNFTAPKYETVDCELSYGTYKLSPQNCESSKKRDLESQQFFAELYEANELNIQEQIDYTYENSKCIQDARDDYRQESLAIRNKLRSLGALDSSAYETSMKIIERNLSQEISICEQRYPIN